MHTLKISIFLGCLACGVALNANADMFPDLWKNSQQGIWQIEGEAAYLSQSNNLLSVHSSDPDAMALGEHFLNAASDPKDQWGPGFSVGYVFPSHKHDIRFSLQYVADKYTTDYDLDSFFAGDPVLVTGATSADYNFNYISAELTIGNYFDLTSNIATRLAYGIIYTNIQENDSSYAQAFAHLDTVQLAQDAYVNFTNHFHGAGLKLAADTKFDMTRHIALVNTLGFGGLYGMTESDVTATACQYQLVGHPSPPPGCEGGSDEFDQHNFTIELDARLGARYNHLLGKRSNFGLELGYQGITYLAALEEIEVSDAAGTSNADGTYYNYGPYASVLFDFM